MGDRIEGKKGDSLQRWGKSDEELEEEFRVIVKKGDEEK